MAGVKGRSGGARPNTGGARPGAGRPRTRPEPPEAPQLGAELADGKKRDPLEFLELVVNDPNAPLKDRIRAAVAAAQYRHVKKHDGGKKDDVEEAAKKAASGRFAPSAPPKLVISNK